MQFLKQDKKELSGWSIITEEGKRISQETEHVQDGKKWITQHPNGEIIVERSVAKTFYF